MVAPKPVRDTRPLWIPPDLTFDNLPPALQIALTEVIGPLYRELVLEAPTELERSAGLTLVHAAWLEVHKQIELNRTLVDPLSRGEGTDELAKLVAESLRLAGTKDRLTKTYLQVRIFLEKRAAPPSPLGPVGGATEAH